MLWNQGMDEFNFMESRGWICNFRRRIGIFFELDQEGYFCLDDREVWVFFYATLKVMLSVWQIGI